MLTMRSKFEVVDIYKKPTRVFVDRFIFLLLSMIPIPGIQVLIYTSL